MILVLAAFFLQWILGSPWLPGWLGEIWVPMVWLVSRPLRQRDRGVFLMGVGIGICWDLFFEQQVIGPGGIAWSAAALAVQGTALVLVDRSPRAWAGLGALAAFVALAVRQLAYLPLGLPLTFWSPATLRICVLTAIWCGLVGWSLQLDLGARWQDYRARRLR
ncbi:MAG: hypothetical protein GY906_19905 [bacterium]|nr:hypothetical protein [bacterium]